MQQAYTFTVPNKNRRYYFLFAALLLLISYIFYFLFAYNRIQLGECTWLRCIILPGAVLAGGIAYGWQQRHRREALIFLYLAAAATWLGNGQYITGAAVLLLGFVFYLVDRDFVFRFTNQAITISSMPPRRYVWAQLQNVILKDGILTIDQKNNKLFQYDISEVTLPFPPAELNEFCTALLKPGN